MKKSFLIYASACSLFYTYAANAGTYYVSEKGSDSNAGTLSAPFRTIQKAASKATAGSTVYIRGGTYRETVTPAYSGTSSAPITFIAYNGEKVTVSGADKITGFKLESGKIHSAPITWSLGAGKDQIFVDSQMMLEAQWPNNTSLDVTRPVLNTVDTVSNLIIGEPGKAKLTDTALSKPSGYWVNARIYIISGSEWRAHVGTVTSSSTNQISVTIPRANTRAYAPKAGNPYYLMGLRSMLDSPGEWHLNSSTKKLAIWMPKEDLPSAHTVEAKRREVAFDLSARSYIRLKGISIFAATVKMSETSRFNILDKITAKYVSHKMINNATSDTIRDTGIIVHGDGNQIINSDIGYSSGNGIRVFGKNHKFTNNVIHHVDYNAEYNAAITTDNSVGGHLIAFNTLYNSGRSLIQHGNGRVKIQNNELFDAGMQAKDLGATYTFNTDGEGSDIAYNVVHDVRAGHIPQVGIYLDNGSRNYNVHHNIVYGAETGIHLNFPSTGHAPGPLNNRIYNNTLTTSKFCLAGGLGVGTKDGVGSIIVNQICNRKIVLETTQGITNRSNLISFEAPYSSNYTLPSGSKAIDAGESVAAASGASAPGDSDLGAIAYGKAPFKYGATRTYPSTPALVKAVSATNTSITMSIPAPPSGMAAIEIQRSSDGVLWEDVAILKPVAQNYTNSGLTQNTRYFYRSRIEDKNGYPSKFSSIVSLRTAGATLVTDELVQIEKVYEAETGVDQELNFLRGGFSNGDWVLVKKRDFSSGTGFNFARVVMGTTTASGATVEVRLDSPNGPLVATIPVQKTGGEDKLAWMQAPLSQFGGVHDIYFVFRGTTSGVFDAFKFYK